MRIFHGPSTVGGIGWHLASWQRQQGFRSDSIVYKKAVARENLYHYYYQVYDLPLVPRILRQLRLFVKFIASYDVFHFYAGASLLPMNLDLPVLWALRKKILMCYCGTDIRTLSVSKDYNEYTHLLDGALNTPIGDHIKRLKMRWQNIWISRFTAGRELYPFAVDIIHPSKVEERPWYNNLGFDSRTCATASGLSTNTVPILLHAPSNKIVKGTKYVRAAVQVLRERGVHFEYWEATGIPNEELIDMIRRSDIVIDQLLLASVGTLAIEGMGLGKPVVAYLPPEVANRFLPGCPVVCATINTLAAVLEELINDADLRLQLGREGIEFVLQNLDYEQTQAETLALYYNL